MLYFHNRALKKEEKVTEVEQELHSMAKKLLLKVYFESSIKGDAFFQERNLDGFPFVHFSPNNHLEINLFKPETFFD